VEAAYPPEKMSELQSGGTLHNQLHLIYQAIRREFQSTRQRSQQSTTDKQGISIGSGDVVAFHCYPYQSIIGADVSLCKLLLKTSGSMPVFNKINDHTKESICNSAINDPVIKCQ
jgi:hypothetical protein